MAKSRRRLWMVWEHFRGKRRREWHLVGGIFLTKDQALRWTQDPETQAHYSGSIYHDDRVPPVFRVVPVVVPRP